MGYPRHSHFPGEGGKGIDWKEMSLLQCRGLDWFTDLFYGSPPIDFEFK